MPRELHIAASCEISKNTVYKNGDIVFKNITENIADFLLAIYNRFNINYPKFYKMDNLSKLGLLATEILLKNSLDKEKYQPEQIGIVLANASSSLDADIKYFETTKDIPSPALFVYTLPNIVMGEVCIRHNFKGENAFFIFEELNIDFIEKYVTGLMNNDILQACICGWVELLEDQYKSVLFLIEKNSYSSLQFTKENINKIYQLHG